jgi:N-methylhydantoinase A
MQTENISAFRIGIDIGGTFTDFVLFNPSNNILDTFKLPTTPDDPSKAVLTGLERIRKKYQNTTDISDKPNQSTPWIIIHGSTVATNALLERKGARTALITTRGFKDVIQIGRQNRQELYRFTSKPPHPLIPQDLRFEVDERVDSEGRILIDLRETQINKVISELKFKKNPINKKINPGRDIDPSIRFQNGIESVAVVLLFSFSNPTHEKQLAKILREEGFFVSASHEILPEYREYERTSTTVINAYVSPILDNYLKIFSQQMIGNDLPSRSSDKVGATISKEATGNSIRMQIMQSNGGCISIAEARRNGVRCILSGPAGGVVGSYRVGQQLFNLEIEGINPFPGGIQKLITFDMGGTSTDVSLIEGVPKVTSEAEVGGYPIRVPILDIHTIGAGGGSIAMMDAGGILRVGPESAGADPGPACYGRGLNKKLNGPERSTLGTKTNNNLLPTVTDANLMLGRILPDHFLGGEMQLFPKLSKQAITQLGSRLKLDPLNTALGIIEIANAHMVRALRVISVERGYDPREFVLLSFGGAGGLHASALARELRIPYVLIPPFASTLSAYGMLAADVSKDYTQTVMLSGDTEKTEIDKKIFPLVEQGYKDIAREGFSRHEIRIEKSLDMRYKGQSFELNIPFDMVSENGTDFRTKFHQEHKKTYGYKRIQDELEIVNIRVRAVGLVETTKMLTKPLSDPDPIHALLDSYKVVFSSGLMKTPFYQGEELKPGNIIEGPAVIVRSDTTILLESGDTGRIDPHDNLVIEVAGGK